MRNRELGGIIAMTLLLVVIGVARTANTIGQPEMAGVRTLHIVSLLGAGFCWGTAFGLLVMAFVWPRWRSNNVAGTR